MQAVQRGNIGKKQAAKKKAHKIEQGLGFLRTEEEAAQIAKMQAAARVKITRQALAEHHMAATKIAAVQRGYRDRARVKNMRVTIAPE